MTCPRCKDERWVRDDRTILGHPCALCNDNGMRKFDEPDPSLRDIVAALPEGHAAKAQYDELVAAFTLQQVRAGKFVAVDMAKPGSERTVEITYSTNTATGKTTIHGTHVVPAKPL